MEEPVFVAIEGIDASGKTTLTAALADVLRGRGVKVAVCKEPSDGPIGMFFRQISRTAGLPPMALALLSAADRHHHQDRVARLCREADVVLADRYYLSGLAYHAADGIDPVYYQDLNRGVLKPTAYLYLDIDPAFAAARRSGVPDGYWEQPAFAAQLPDTYRTCLALVTATEAAQVIRIDARQPPQRVLRAALAAVASLSTTLRSALTPDLREGNRR